MIEISKKAKEFIQFVNSAPSPFHAVDKVCAILAEAGFIELSDKSSWDGKIAPLGKYYVTKNNSCAIAFAVGGKYSPGNGIGIVGAHTDSPCLKLKPRSNISNNGFCKVGVETYGGGLWHTWFDRDLGIAGRVIVRDGDKLKEKLVHIHEPIMNVPSLAIHLDRAANDSFKFNKETNFVPVISLTEDGNKEKSATQNSELAHNQDLLKKIAKTLEVEVSDIFNFELCLFDVNKSTVGGLNNEFIYSARLDNLNSTFCAISGLVSSLTARPLDEDEKIRMVALFDNEEVGSQSAYGAQSAFFENTLRRIVKSGNLTSFEETIAKSYLISADMAHAVHPNYSEKHEQNHMPAFFKGPVIKTNVNQRYATTAETSAILKMIAANSKIPVQEFVVRNDSPCGSTIGPIMSSRLGLRTIDIGNPMLGMHSIRETMSTKDVDHMCNLLTGFFSSLDTIDIL